MKNYILDLHDGNVCFYLYNVESASYELVPNVTIDKLFNILDKMLESMKTIEKLHLVDNVLEFKAIYLNDEGFSKEETYRITINNKLLNNQNLKYKLYKRINHYNVDLKQETNENIANIRFNPINVRKRRLENEKRLMTVS